MNTDTVRCHCTGRLFRCARRAMGEVSNPSGSGKDTANGKGVVGDCESEGSRRQNSGLMDRNHTEAVYEGKTALQAEAQ